MQYCRPCDRWFDTTTSLWQHARSMHSHVYCSRCQRYFSHERALEQHVIESSRHHVCLKCDDEPDFHNENELNHHLEEEHHICLSCRRIFWDADELSQHDEMVHHICPSCGMCFLSDSNLRNHLLTHRTKEIECFGCSRIFITTFAMVLHLEAGTCQSGADKEYVTDVAHDCYQSRHYTSGRQDSEFCCPTCDMHFFSMSALLQHVESEACDEDLRTDRALGKFLHYLDKRLYDRKS